MHERAPAHRIDVDHADAASRQPGVDAQNPPYSCHLSTLEAPPPLGSEARGQLIRSGL